MLFTFDHHVKLGGYKERWIPSDGALKKWLFITNAGTWAEVSKSRIYVWRGLKGCFKWLWEEGVIDQDSTV